MPRPSVSQRLLRRTASAPAKSQKPGHKAFPELVLGTQDAGSEAEAPDVAPPSPGLAPEALAREEPGGPSPRGKVPAERSPGQGRPPRGPEGPGPAGMAASCMKCVVGSCAGEDAESLRRGRPPSPGPQGEQEAIGQQPRARADLLGAPHAVPGRGSRGSPPGPGGGRSVSGSGSPGSPEGAASWPEGTRRQPGALQREMNALFVQKLEEIRSKSPMFSTGKTGRPPPPVACPPPPVACLRMAWPDPLAVLRVRLPPVCSAPHSPCSDGFPSAPAPTPA